MPNMSLIYGHRGVPVKFPENSLAGFAYAISHHIDGLEFDVHLTQDQIPVIMHDERIDRTTNGQGAIADLTFEQLRRFELANGEPVHLNLELKTDRHYYLDIERIVLRMVRQTDLIYPVVFSSFNLKSLQRAYAIDASQKYAFLTSARLGNPDEFATHEHLEGVHLEHYQPVHHVAERVWTVDEPIVMQQLFAASVNAVITNNFELAQQVRAAM
ncbi:glycerophosphodiester phosphodiesterase [Lactiplantibacillus plantarum]|uniref:glycerophosphodiester phosphodiesterase n=1 Tax=Lactiplantibacillus plantarum TaxID=1590 RepID=UPI00062D8668|nr:glycerophosphodiester phosphodiesterase family protein [Lactiplantibacillus plantarum]KLD41204.1 glycerophosphodiester phosphodiesterase [Lactiplantibacillus plantarum]KLD60135.1 glycerophosphodiester phosphodiesterase [Lactiplantibacillus plantarum]KZU52055.1 Glycerophosphoryl diester phosphodiesterase [Lactiplantibacillus plantarum]MCG3569045.1 glycerophosphodiester phosphodiesterase [Lactiplantibacillus plantarum]MCG3571859.1 glycerophosphodiester phosphodiesterase [Lactiplantibacillus p